MQTIKISRNVALAIFLSTAISFAGCKGTGKTAGSDRAATDTSMKKTDSLKMDSPKMAPADSASAPPNHVPKKDSTVTPRPLVRKT